MKNMTTKWMLAAVLVLLTACEKAYDDQSVVIDEGKNDRGNVTLRVVNLEMMPFSNVTLTKATGDVGNVCSHLNIAVFQNDEKVSSVNQKEGDQGFGTVSMNLPTGTYDLVVIAHNCTGSATISSPSKITFPSNIITDTFYYYGQLTVGSQAQTVDISLTRAVAMYRLNITDDMPNGVDNMKFYYTGGSSTFDATTGFGNVNSRQTVNIGITSDMKGKPSTFEVYTFPHQETGTLKMTVTAEDSQKAKVMERVFEDVPIQRNVITQMSGEFFSGSAAGQAITLQADDAWAGLNELTY